MISLDAIDRLTANNLADSVTRATSVVPGGASPIWRRFLDRVPNAWTSQTYDR
jgi:hypothetical protein